MTNNDLNCKTKISLKDTGQKIILKDGNMTTGWNLLLSSVSLSSLSVKSIVKVDSTKNGVIYDKYYTNNEFGNTPDIHSSQKNIEIDLPTNIDGKAVKDTYRVYYKFRVSLPTIAGQDGQLIGVFGTNIKYIAIKGNYLSLTGANPKDIKIQIYTLGTETLGVGVYTITSVEYDIGTDYTKYYISETPNNFLNTLNDYGVGIIFEHKDKCIYNQTQPKLDIEISASCNNSTLTAKDITNYKLNKDEVSFTISSMTRNWKIKSPTIKYNDITENTKTSITIGNGTIYNSGHNIYTGNYNVILQTLILYTSDSFDLEYELLGNENFEVKCDFCLCDLFKCIDNIKTKYELARTNNFTEAERLQRQLTSIIASYQLYNIAERCGEETQVYCNYIRAIADFENCQCDNNNTKEAIEVIPISSLASLNINITAITTGLESAGYPASPSINALHLYTDTYDLYKYNGTNWMFQCNLKGAKGDTGTKGDSGNDGKDGVVLLWNNLTDTNATNNTGYQNISDKHTIEANTLEAGDCLELEAIYKINCNYTTSVLFDLIGIKIEQVIAKNQNEKYVKLKAYLNIENTTTTKITRETTISPNVIITKQDTTTSLDWTNDNDFYASAFKILAGTNSDITLILFKAILHKL